VDPQPAFDELELGAEDLVDHGLLLGAEVRRAEGVEGVVDLLVRRLDRTGLEAHLGGELFGRRFRHRRPGAVFNSECDAHAQRHHEREERHRNRRTSHPLHVSAPVRLGSHVGRAGVPILEQTLYGNPDGGKAKFLRA